MIKLMFCLRRRADLSREEFLAHWSGPHARIGIDGANAIGARRYVQSHTLSHNLNDALRDSRGAPEPFDGVVELWFDDTDSIAKTFSGAEARKVIAELVQDEHNFVDLEASPIFLVEEHQMWPLE